VSSLIRTDPDQARVMVVKLSKVLRRLLRKHENFSALRDELSFIEDYLAIEVVRFGAKLRFEKDVAEDKMCIRDSPITAWGPMWRTYSYAPRRDSSRCPANTRPPLLPLRFAARHRHDCRCGGYEYVRHIASGSRLAERGFYAATCVI